MNVKGRWLKKTTTWRKISLNTWSPPDNATIYGHLEIDVGPLQDFLKRRSDESGVRCTLTHAVTRALGLCLRRYPEANVLVRGRRIWLRDEVDIFHQVAMPTGEKGRADLGGATVRRVDTKRIEQISTELHASVQQVREKRDGAMARTRSLLLHLPNVLSRWSLRVLGWLQYRCNLAVPAAPRDPFGGAMVTAVGMLGIDFAYAPLVTFSRVPIILLVGAVADRPVVRDGQIVIRPICHMTASIDHRILDGYQASHLAAELRRILEHPEELDKEP